MSYILQEFQSIIILSLLSCTAIQSHVVYQNCDLHYIKKKKDDCIQFKFDIAHVKILYVSARKWYLIRMVKQRKMIEMSSI